MSGFVCGVDIGGTFTDCVLIGDDGRVAYGKALSSPDDSFQSGFFGSIDAAAAQLGLDARRRVHAHGPPDLARLDGRHEHRRRAQGRAASG